MCGHSNQLKSKRTKNGVFYPSLRYLCFIYNPCPFLAALHHAVGRVVLRGPPVGDHDPGGQPLPLGARREALPAPQGGAPHGVPAGVPTGGLPDHEGLLGREPHAEAKLHQTHPGHRQDDVVLSGRELLVFLSFDF